MSKEKSYHIKAYEIKNSKTAIGAIMIMHYNDNNFCLPHLRGDWHWVLEWEECDCNE